MLLSYRGYHYETHATITTQLSQPQDFTTAKYRGVSYKIASCQPVQNPHPTQLKYRGVTYIGGQ